MAFTAKVTVSGVEPNSLNDQSLVSFRADYEREGERVNQDWAKYTPGATIQLWLTAEFMQAHPELVPGKPYTLTFTEDAA